MAKKRYIYADIPLEWLEILNSLPVHYVIGQEESTPYINREQVEYLLHRIISTIPVAVTVDKKSSGVKVDYDSVLATVKTLTSGGCTGSIHFYKDGEVRIEIT